MQKYEIIRSLNSGNFGEVFKVKDTALATVKALKLVEIDGSTEYKDALEAQLMRECRHPNCVTVNEVNIFSIGGKRYYAIDMEFAPNGSLDGLITADSGSFGGLLSIFKDALYGLANAHSKSVIHADIKPGNILLFGNSSKLSDFGLAFNSAAGNPPPDLKYFTHIAPEMVGTRVRNIRTDLYAMGVTMFRAFNRLADWDAAQDHLTDVREAIRTGKFLGRVGFEDFVPSKLRRIINRACHIDPGSRYESAADLRQALDRLAVRVDWRRDGPSQWIGIENTKTHVVEANPSTNAVIHTVNGRKNTSNCSRHSTSISAAREMNRVVAQTSLE
ncbi:MAG: serine/threonine-protein kinase [Micropepsaceae bacterium]